jgi:hypothetical protein
LFFSSFFLKDSHKYVPDSKISKMDFSLGAVVIGAKIKRLGASPIGAKLLAHVGVDAELAVT